MILDISVCLLMLSPLTKRTLVMRSNKALANPCGPPALDSVADEFKVSTSGSPDFQSKLG